MDDKILLIQAPEDTALGSHTFTLESYDHFTDNLVKSDSFTVIVLSECDTSVVTLDISGHTFAASNPFEYFIDGQNKKKTIAEFKDLSDNFDLTEFMQPPGHNCGVTPAYSVTVDGNAVPAYGTEIDITGADSKIKYVV